MDTPDQISHRSTSAGDDDSALSAIAEGVEAETGDRFFSSLARHPLSRSAFSMPSSRGFPMTAHIS